MCQFKTLAFFLISLFVLSCSNNSPNQKNARQNEELQNYIETNGHYYDSISKIKTKAQVRYNDSIENLLMKESENKRNEIEKIYEDSIENMILRTATSPEIREVFDELYSQALRYSGGNIEQAQEVLRGILKDELSDERILEKYFENVEVKEYSLGNWKISSKKNRVERTQK